MIYCFAVRQQRIPFIIPFFTGNGTMQLVPVKKTRTRASRISESFKTTGVLTKMCWFQGLYCLQCDLCLAHRAMDLFWAPKCDWYKYFSGNYIKSQTWNKFLIITCKQNPSLSNSWKVLIVINIYIQRSKWHGIAPFYSPAMKRAARVMNTIIYILKMEVALITEIIFITTLQLR